MYIHIKGELSLIAAGKRQGFNVKELLVNIVEAGIAQEVGSELNIANPPQLTIVLTQVPDHFDEDNWRVYAT